MAHQQIVVKTPTRARKWGWGYAFQPAPAPTRPDYVGTIRQVMHKRSLDPTWRARNGAHTMEALFFDRKPVVAVDGQPVSQFLRSFERGWDDESAALYFEGGVTLTVEVANG